MLSSSIRIFSLLLALLLPGLALAQGHRYDERAEIRVLNDWEETVTVMIIAERHDELVRRTWDFAPGEGAYLAMLHDGRERRIRVRGTDRIKIRRDFPSIAISDVGRYRNGYWFVKVRDVYRAQRSRDDVRRDHDRDHRRDAYRY